MTDRASEGTTQAERRTAAVDVMTTLMDVDADDAAVMADAMERRHGHLGSFANDHVLGTLWSRPQLNRRDRSLIVVTFLAVVGADAELVAHIRGAINHGVTRQEIRELVHQVAGYAGFPMAMKAARIVDKTFAGLDGVERLPEKSPSPPIDDQQRWVQAADVLGTLTGGRAAEDPAEARHAVVEALGGVGELAFDWGFGELWARDELSRRDRSLATVAILAMLRCRDELAFHVPAALHHGLSRAEVEEVMVQLTVYGGFPRAVEGIRAARAAFAEIDAKAGGPRNEG